MKSNARKASLAGPGVTGIARVGRPASDVLPRLRRGDIAVLDHVDLDRDTASALLEAGVRAVVNAAPMISGRYANLGPEVLAEAGVLVVDQVGQDGLDRIRDNLPVRVDGGRVLAVLPDGRTELLATGRVVDLERVHSEMDQAHSGRVVELDALTRTTGDFLRREHDLLLRGRGLPEPTTRIAGRAVVVVGTADHAELQAIAPFVREQAPVVIAVGAAADDLFGLSWAADIVVVAAGGTSDLPSADALRVAGDVVLVVSQGSGLDEQARIEAVAGPPHLVDTSASAEDVGLLLADHQAARLVIGVGLHSHLEELLDGDQPVRESSVATRLKLGDRLVDAHAVKALYTGRAGPALVVPVLLAGLVALLAAIAVTPVGQDWAHDVVDYLQGLT
ncbi:putative cytokinetic ring protein SteA [Nocardioides halotolerans]|uniref:putative cytokinetic ring protein SteA n=1 Tax=Nocardioides halotolerans TaxID=433660 RepID=UPI0004219971|nr:putative cytokinetic ring protein SteA [Nocardioides halotolerans]